MNLLISFLVIKIIKAIFQININSHYLCLSIIIEEYIYILSFVNVIILLIYVIRVYKITKAWWRKELLLLLLLLTWTEIIINPLHHLLLLTGHFLMHRFTIIDCHLLAFWDVVDWLFVSVNWNYLLLVCTKRYLRWHLVQILWHYHEVFISCVFYCCSLWLIHLVWVWLIQEFVHIHWLGYYIILSVPCSCLYLRLSYTTWKVMTCH